MVNILVFVIVKNMVNIGLVNYAKKSKEYKFLTEFINYSKKMGESKEFIDKLLERRAKLNE